MASVISTGATKEGADWASCSVILNRATVPSLTISGIQFVKLMAPLFVSKNPSMQEKKKKTSSEWLAFYNSWQWSERGQEFSTSFYLNSHACKARGPGRAANLQNCN